MRIQINKFFFLFGLILFSNYLLEKPLPAINFLNHKQCKPLFEVFQDLRYSNSIGGNKKDKTLPIMTIWSDGTITDEKSILIEKLTLEETNLFLKDLERTGFFDDRVITRRQWVGPDSGFVVIRAELNGVVKTMESWHPLYEKNGKLVATDSGIEVLGKRNLPEVVEKCASEYRSFRKIWLEIKSLVKSYVGNYTGTTSW